MIPRLLLLLGFLCLTLPVGRAAADSAASYLLIRQTVRGPLLTAAQSGDLIRHPNAYAGRTLDAAAIVSGLVTAGDTQTALLTLGGESVTVPVPSLPSADALTGGAHVRVLLLSAPDDSALPSGLRLLAVAPEGIVVAAEVRQADQIRRAQMQSAWLRGSLSVSRSLPARRDGRRGGDAAETVGDAGHPVGALSARALAIYAPYRKMVRRWNRRLSETDVDKITTSILYFSDRNGIDPRLVVATIIAESDFDLTSTSRTGAMGLAQLMPDTARGLGVTDAYDPVQNIGAAVHILRGHLDQYGGAPADAGVISFDKIALTMAAYNAGPGAVKKYHGVPPYRETQRYIKRVSSLYRQMCGISAAAK